MSLKNKEGTIHIYHHGDMDGIMAGASIYHLINLYKYDKKLYKINNYNQLMDFSNVNVDDILFFVDYSFTNKDNVDALRDLIDRLWKYDCKGHIFWIDHHKTSLDIMEDFPLNIVSKVIDTDFCGAVLSYIFAYNASSTNPDGLLAALNSTFYILKCKKDKIRDEVPVFLRYVNSWDIWKHDYAHDSEFNLGFTLRYSEPSDERLGAILYDDNLNEYSYCDELIEKGSVIKEYMESVNKQRVQEMGYDFTLDGYKCIMYNGRGSSLTFGDLIKEYDICAMFYFTGDTYIYSLYSETIDTSEISKRFGGGGHPGASGFQSKELLFKKGTIYNSGEMKDETV